jgi:hypothetical protein
MSRKKWSEYERMRQINKLECTIEYLEAKVEHLRSDNWQELYKFRKEDFGDTI